VLPSDIAPARISANHLFGEDTNDTAIMESALYGLVEGVGWRLRARHKAAGALRIVLDHCDGVRRSHAMALKPATADDAALFVAACSVLTRTWTRRVRVRRINLTCERLVRPSTQMDLFDPRPAVPASPLIKAIDGIRRRFGTQAIRMGRTVEPMR
jgi:DNA polymerase-4